MIKQRVKFIVSLREAAILLLLTLGTLLWALPEPDVTEACYGVAQSGFASGVIAEHNAAAAQPVQALSELSREDIHKAASAVHAKEIAAFQAVRTKCYVTAVAYVAAACCWLLAVLGVLNFVRRGRDMLRYRSIATHEEQMQTPAPPSRGTPVPLGGGI